jgi:hypothetical protein
MEFYSGKYGFDRRRAVGSFGGLDTLAYATGDILTSGAVAFGNVTRSIGMSGSLVRVILEEVTNVGSAQRPALRLWWFGASVTPASRNSPQAFTGTQLDALVGTNLVQNADWIVCATGVASWEATISLPFVLQPNSTTLYCVPEVRGAYTFHSSTQITAQIVVEAD